MTATLQRVTWSRLDDPGRRAWLLTLRPDQPEADVSAILADVRDRGEAALRELTARLDGVDLADPWVSDAEWETAHVDATISAALEDAAAAVGRYHAEQRNALRAERRVRTRPGVTAWRRWQPIGRIGGYVPGGRAAYPSSVLMLAVPARLAGVEELIVATPPRADGSVPPAVLAAARIGGVSRILKAGGAQAIAALAYGTTSIEPVDKIFGAGNAWVTAAKRAVSNRVAIDLPAGPSECVVLADGAADADLVALDLLAQAEHGPDSVAIVVSDDGALLDAIDAALPRAAAGLATGDDALATIQRLGAAVLVADLESGVDVVNDIAPEHVSLQCAAADDLALKVRNAGAVFIGPWSPIAAGDYATGTNHVLPTGGAARAWGGIGVESFGRWVEVQRLTPHGLQQIAPTVATIAGAEGLPAHSASVTERAKRASRALEPAADDPLDLLRRPEWVVPYPAEPSSEDLAARAGLSVEVIVRADMNTVGPGAIAALGGFDGGRINEYGDLAYARLRAALGRRHDVDSGRIVPGAGADELIRLVTTQAVGEGDAVLVPTPTFAMFAVEALLAGARVVDLPRSQLACRQSPEEVRRAAADAAARLVWLCTPNNPTGDAYRLDEIRAIADGLPALVCVDEVYVEFAEDAMGVAPDSTSAIRLQDELSNVIVLRSLSKSHGIAGARVGYAVVPGSLAERFAGARLPLSVSAPSEALALAVLEVEDTARDRRRAVLAARTRLAVELELLGCEVLPSVINSVAFRPPIDAELVDDGLLARGVAVRRYESGPMAGWLRATARLEPDEGRLIAALREVLA
jgi:histidinol dehydrogenase